MLAQEHKQVLSSIRDLLLAIQRASGSHKVVGDDAYLHRRQLCEAIHTQGWDYFIRPLSANERDRMLGFPAGASASQYILAEAESEWLRLNLTGNSYAVPIFAAIIKEWVEAIRNNRPCKLVSKASRIPSSPSEFLKILGASSLYPLA